MYHPSKGLHVRCVTIGCQLDTATASARFFTLHSSLFTLKKRPPCPLRYHRMPVRYRNRVSAIFHSSLFTFHFSLSSKGLHVRCVTIGRQLDTATASARFFTLHFSLSRKSHCVRRVTGGYKQETPKKEEQKALHRTIAISAFRSSLLSNKCARRQMNPITLRSWIYLY